MLDTPATAQDVRRHLKALRRRVQFLTARASPRASDKSYDLAERRALLFAIESIETLYPQQKGTP